RLDEPMGTGSVDAVPHPPGGSSMDDPEGVAARRGKTLKRRHVGPPIAVAAAIAVACMFGTPDGAVPKRASGGDSMDENQVREFVRRFRKGQEKFGSGKDAEAEAIFRELL